MVSYKLGVPILSCSTEPRRPGDSDMKRPALRFSMCLISAAAIAVSQAGGVAVADVSARQVLDSIEKAKRVLLAQQQPDGSWKTGGGWGEQFPVGVSSLALLALLNTGMTVADPEIQRGLTWLRKQPQPTSTYEISLLIQALAAAKDGRRDFAKVAAL